MKQYIKLMEFENIICIRSYKTSKTIKIRINKNIIEISKPLWVSKKYVIEYLQKNRKQIIELLNLQKTTFDSIVYLGNMYKIRIKSDINEPIIEFKNNEIIINSVNNDKSEIIKKEFTKRLKVILDEELFKICKQMQIDVPKYKIKDCKTMWGSCSIKGNLNFNFRIVMMEINCIRCIIIHELCHLKFMNHSKVFWNEVYKYISKEKYIESKKWIKAYMKNCVI